MTQKSVSTALLAAHRRTVIGPVTSMSSDRKSTRLNSSHGYISYAVFCLKKKKQKETQDMEGIKKEEEHTRDRLPVGVQHIQRRRCSHAENHTELHSDHIQRAREMTSSYS